MKAFIKRVLAILLAVGFCFTSVPATVNALESGETVTVEEALVPLENYSEEVSSEPEADVEPDQENEEETADSYAQNTGEATVAPDAMMPPVQDTSSSFASDLPSDTQTSTETTPAPAQEPTETPAPETTTPIPVYESPSQTTTMNEISETTTEASTTQPPYEEYTTLEELTTTEETTAATKTFFEYEDPEIYVSAELNEADALPEEAVFVVKQIFEDSILKEDRDIYAWAEQILNDSLDKQEMVPVNTFYYDMYFEVNGSRLMLTEEFEINITYKQEKILNEDAAWDNVRIYHLDDNDLTGRIEAVDTNAELNVDGLGALTTARFWISRYRYTPLMISMIETKEDHEERLAAEEAAAQELSEETESETEEEKKIIYLEDPTEQEEPSEEESSKKIVLEVEETTETKEPESEPEKEQVVEETSEQKTEESNKEETEEKEEEEEEKEEQEEEQPQTRRYYTTWGSDVNITVTLSDPEQVPDSAQVVVTPVTPQAGDYNYDAYLEALNNAGDGITYTADNTLLYDIKFIDTIVSEDGTEQTVEYEPAEGTVRVSLRFNQNQLSEEINAENPEDVTVNHLVTDVQTDTADVSASDIAVVSVDADVTLQGQADHVTFSTESFSVYSFTVDFHYQGVDYSIPGESQILLSELIGIMNIAGEDGELIPVADVESVTFTDEHLVTVQEVSGLITYNDAEDIDVGEKDFLLTSKEAFQTDEVLTITLSSGEEIIVNVTDAVTTDLTPLLTAAIIKIDGQTVAGSDWAVRPDVDYDITLKFMENSGLQFVNDDTPMTFILPDGLEASLMSGQTFSVRADNKTIAGNTYSITKNSAGQYVLTVKWNTEDPNFQSLTDSGMASLKFNITCQIKQGTSELNFSDSVEKNVDIDNSHNASVTKSGYYDTRDQKIHYTVTVHSEGESENVSVNDVISGTAVKMNADDKISMYRSSTNTTTDVSSSKRPDGKGFSYQIGHMANNETVRFTYTASVDIDKLARSGQTTFDETGNTIRMTAEDDDNPNDNTSTHYERNINFTGSIGKNSTSISGIVERDGKKYKTVTWQITENPERTLSLGGSTVTDRIADASKSIMKYSGDGIYVSRNDGAAVCITWSELGVNTATADSWTYTIPNYVGKDKLVITYTTEVEITDETKDVTVSNIVDGKPGTSYGNAPVHQGSEGHSGGEHQPSGPPVSKAFSYVSDSEIVWKVAVNVDKAGYDEFHIEDWLPRCDFDNKLFDTIENLETDITVEGLLPGEAYSTERLYIPINTDCGSEGWHDVDYEAGVKLTFYKDSQKTQTGLLENTGDRVITVTLKTKVNQTWLEKLVNSPVSGSNNHRNNAKVHTDKGDSSASAVVSPRQSHMEKMYLSTSTLTIGGKSYTAYKYEIYLEGVTQEGIDIEDTFDTNAFYLYQGVTDCTTWQSINQDYNQITGSMNGGNSFTSDPDNPNQTIEHAEFTETETGFKFSTSILPRTGTGSFFPFYKVIYYLVPKGDDGLAYMKQRAIEEGGIVTFTNTAEYNGGSSSVDIDYQYKALSKDVSGQADGDGYYTYTITINAEKEWLNNGNNLTLTDTYSGMTVDYTTISYVTDPAENAADITYNYSGNVGTYSIPDGTKVILTYKVRPVGSGNVKMYNRVEMKGYSAVSEKYVTTSSNAEGSAITGKIVLLKYAAGDMTVPLSGAKFALYELVNGSYEPVRYGSVSSRAGEPVTFTTGEDGTVLVSLREGEDGVYLKIHYTDPDTGEEYYKDVVYALQEIEPPTGYEVDNTMYQFSLTLDPGEVSYANGKYIYLNNDVLKVADKPEAGIRIKKIVKGLQLSDEAVQGITFTVTGPDGYSRSISYADFVNGQYKLPDAADHQAGINSLPIGSYTVTENIVSSNGEVLSSVTYRIDNGRPQEADNAAVEITEEDIAENRDHLVTITNTYESAQIKVIKTAKADGSKLSGATFLLEKEEGAGYTTVDTLTITEENKNSGIVFSNLTSGSYRLTETQAPYGYTPLTTPIRFTVEGSNVRFYNGNAFADNLVTFDEGTGTFTVQNEKPKISVVKRWVDNGSGRPESVSVTLQCWKYYSYWETVSTKELNADNGWSCEFEDLDANLQYKVVETVPSGYAVSYSSESLTAGDTVTVTNTKTSTGIQVLKEWVGGEGGPVTVQLWRKQKSSGNGNIPVKVSINWGEEKQVYSVSSGDVMTLSVRKADLSWGSRYPTVIFTNVSSQREEDVDGWLTYYCTVPNGIQDVKVNINDWNAPIDYVISSVGAGGDDNSSFEFVESKTLSSANNWYYAWENLDSGYVYAVEETPVPGYTTSYSSNNAAGISKGIITITNTRSASGSITVRKSTTVNGENDSRVSGQTVRVGLFDREQTASIRDTAVQERVGTITLDGNGSGSITFNDLNLGTYYVYEVDAQNRAILANGTVTVNGNEYTVSYGSETEDNVVELSSTTTSGTVDVTNSRETGRLIIRKTFAEDSDLQAADLTTEQKQSIRFLIEGPSFGENGEEITYLTLGADGSRTFIDLIPGTYKVTETNALTGYNASTTFKVGTRQGTGTEAGGITVSSGTPAEVEFVNKYEQLSVNAQFRIRKTVTPVGTENYTKDEEFEFTLESYGVENNGSIDTSAAGKASVPMPDSNQSVKIKDKAEGQFGEIIYHQPGTYYYKITEATPEEHAPGMTYAGPKYVRVIVTLDEEANRLQSSVSYSDNVANFPAGSTGTTLAEFVNTYEVGKVEMKKTFIGLTEEELPEGFMITAEWSEGEEQFSYQLTTDGVKLKEGQASDSRISGPETDTGSADDALIYTWTISDLPVGTVVTFKESAYEKESYSTATAKKASSEDSFTDGGNEVAETVEADTTKTAELKNTYTKGTALPSTGGIGTTLFTVLGAFLIAGAGAGFLIRSRKRKKNDSR